MLIKNDSGHFQIESLLHREKLQIQELLCTANRNGAVHGVKPSIHPNSSKTGTCGDTDNSENAYLPTVGRWGCEWPRESKSDVPLKCVQNQEICDETSLINGLEDNGAVFKNNNPFRIKYNLLDELLDITQVHGPWLSKHPLPLPVWAQRTKDVLKFDSIWQYEYFASQIEFQIQQLLDITIIIPLIIFTRTSLISQIQIGYSYELIFRYLPPITPLHYTCVGLALELWIQLVKLNEKFPGLTNYLYLVSCEENIETIEEYTSLGDHLDRIVTSLEKEHVLLALRFEISGRYGVLLCDPGYHVARVVTVMTDQQYPHTGKFVQSQEIHTQKEYNYAFSSNMSFIQWTEILTKTNEVTTQDVALIYISKPYLTAVDVTERRNLVYNFRSLLSRDSKGILKAGVYFKIKENYDEFTVFYKDGATKKRFKYNFGMFLQGERITDCIRDVLRECSIQLNLNKDALESILMSLANVLADKNYIKQLLEINCQINNLAEDN
ncbi:hypothetical protein FQR65_LT01695 [Abscondita terminalis]|nr:hypothetical protein FQR65_LT01695 [Abscondita terminalis]